MTFQTDLNIILPERWELKSLGEFVKVLNGFAFKSSDFTNKGIAVIKIKNITPPEVTFQEIKCYGGFVDTKLKPFLLQKGDILISMTGSHVNQFASAVGKVARFNSNNPALLNQRIAKIIVDEAIADKDYIYLFLSTKKVQYYLAKSAAGSANQANISSEAITSIKIPLPPLAEQKQIARILSVLNCKIDLNKKMNTTLEGIGQAAYERWFVDFEFPNEEGKPYKSSGGEIVFSEELGKEVPEGWKVKPIDEIADFLNGLALQKFPAREGEEYLPVIKIRELRQGITESSDKANLDLPEEYIVNNGDVLFSWSGSLEVVIWGFGKGALNQHLFKVTSSKYSKWFFYYWVLHYLPEFRQIAAGKATTMGHIQRHHLTASQVIVPDDKTLERMDKLLAPILERISGIKVETKVLSEIRDLLLPKLMSGKIRIPIQKENVEASLCLK